MTGEGVHRIEERKRSGREEVGEEMGREVGTLNVRNLYI